MNWTLAVNNADHLVPSRVHLSWPPLPAGAVVVGVRVRRLAWDAAEEIPALTDTQEHGVLTLTILLAPAEIALVTVSVEAAALTPNAHINTRRLICLHKFGSSASCSSLACRRILVVA